MSYRFEPPTYQQYRPQDLMAPRQPRIGLTEAVSIVRVGGVLTAVKSPSSDQLVGTEGVDFFRGGHVYVVSDATATELQAAGFTNLTLL